MLKFYFNNDTEVLYYSKKELCIRNFSIQKISKTTVVAAMAKGITIAFIFVNNA